MIKLGLTIFENLQMKILPLLFLVVKEIYTIFHRIFSIDKEKKEINAVMLQCKCDSYTMVCLSVQRENPKAFCEWISPYRITCHDITCTLQKVP